MEEIKKLGVGGVAPDSLMHGGIINNPDHYRYNFEEWSVNENAVALYEVSFYKITIKKFKPNVWLFKSKHTSPLTNEGIAEYSKNLTLDVYGFSNNSNVFTTYFQKHSVVGGSGATVGHGLGLLIMPWCTDNAAASQPELPWSAYVWDSMTLTSGTRTQIASEGVLRGQGGGYNQYRHTTDGVVTFTPDWNQFDCPWNRWNLSIGLFTGNTDVVDEDGYITLDTPIVITQLDQVGVDPTAEEVWDAYMGNTQVWHKNKTVENAWIKYGIAHVATWNNKDYLIIDGASVPSGNKINLCEVSNLDDYLPGLRYNLTAANDNILEYIQDYYNNHYVDVTYVQSFGLNTDDARHNGLYSKSNITECTLNLQGESMSCNAVFSKSTVQTINLNVEENSFISSPQHMFYNCYDLTTINFTGPSCGCNDCSGMFTSCKNLTTYPSNLVDWSKRQLASGINKNSNMCYFCDGATGMVTIPSFNEADREADNNTIITGTYIPQMFNNCPNLVSIGPVLDLKQVNPGDSGNIYHTFFNCIKLTDVRIKNLNHGNWDFTNENTKLTSIDEQSVKFLINHLFDLKATGFDELDNSKPKNTSATIKCPSAWQSYITSGMTTEANSKGWTITYA